MFSKFRLIEIFVGWFRGLDFGKSGIVKRFQGFRRVLVIELHFLRIRQMSVAGSVSCVETANASEEYDMSTS